MNDLLNYNAIMAWTAFGAQDYSGLEKYGNEIYNYFVHSPAKILKLDNPLLIGKVFQICLGFKEPDKDIQEVRAENAFICFSQALKSNKTNIHDEASARLMMLLIQYQMYLKNQVELAYQNESVNPYNIFSVFNNGLPKDMPADSNTKMLFTSYYLYNGIIDKDNVCDEFISAYERNIFEHVKTHVLDNCSKLIKTTANRKIELGSIIYDKLCKKLYQDIKLCSDRI